MKKNNGSAVITRFISFVCSVACMVIVMLLAASSCFAEDGGVARIGDVYYDTLQEAFDACTDSNIPAGSTIYLMKDITAEVTGGTGSGNKIYAEVKSGKDITLDLNGHKIQAAKDVIILSIPYMKKLTMTDSSEAKTGELIANERAAVSVVASGEFIFNGGKLSGNVGSFGILDANWGYITMNGGVIEGNHPVDVCNSSVLTINNGIITATTSGRVIESEESKIRIRGGTITGGKSSTGYITDTIYIEGGSLDMSGGKIVSLKRAVVLVKYQYNSSSEPKPATGYLGGGTIEAPETGVYISNGSTFEMTGGTITAATGVNANYNGKALLYGGKVSGTTEAVLIEGKGEYASSAVVAGDAKLTGLENGNALVLKGKSSATVMKGNLVSNKGNGLLVQDSASCELKPATSGGYSPNMYSNINAKTCISVNGSDSGDPASVIIDAVDANGETAVELAGSYDVQVNDGFFSGDTMFSTAGNGKATVTGGSYQKDISDLIGSDEHLVFDENAEVYVMEQQLMPGSSFFKQGYYRLTKKDLEYFPETTESTCIMPAHKACYLCYGCGRYFKNEDHTGEMTFKDVFGVDDFTQLAPGPHDLKDIAEIPAGCESTGVAAHYECNLCGMWFSDEAGTQATNSEQCVINALGHNYGAWTYLNEDQHQRICSRVTSHVETEYHTWDGGVVTKEPTETEEGVRTYTCTACNATYTESIAKIDPSGSDPGGNGGNSGTENDPTPGQSSGSNPAPGQSSGGNPEQMGNDGTAVGLGASAAAAEKAITNMVSDDDPQGTVFGKLALKSPKQKKTSIDLRWNTVPNASLYVIYGNKCGKGIKPVKLAAVNGNRQTVSTVANQKVAKGTYYKFIVVALDKNNNVVSSSRVIHVATKGGKVGNHKKVTVSKSVIRKAKKLKVGKSLKLKAKAVPQSKKLKVKKHVAVRYESTDVNIATVSKKGVVKAKNKGTCYVYAYAQNGVFKAIKVVVK